MPVAAGGTAPEGAGLALRGRVAACLAALGCGCRGHRQWGATRAGIARLRHRCLDHAQRAAAQLPARHRADPGWLPVVRDLGRRGPLQRRGVHRVRPRQRTGPARQRRRCVVRGSARPAVDQRFARQCRVAGSGRSLGLRRTHAAMAAGAGPRHGDGRAGAHVAAVRRPWPGPGGAGWPPRVHPAPGRDSAAGQLPAHGGRCARTGVDRYARWAW